MVIEIYDTKTARIFLTKDSSFNKTISKLDIRSTLKNNGRFYPFLVLGNALNNLTFEDEFLGWSVEELARDAFENLFKIESVMTAIIPSYIPKDRFNMDEKYESFCNKNRYFIDKYTEIFRSEEGIYNASIFNNYLVFYIMTHNKLLTEMMYSMVSVYQDSEYMRTLEKRMYDTNKRINTNKNFILAEPEVLKSDLRVKISHKTIDTFSDIIKEELMLDR